MYIFNYKEDISTNNIEPIIATNSNEFHCISEYFYYLKENEKQILKEIYNYSKKIEGNYFNGTINKNSWLKYIIAKGIKINPISKSIDKGNIKIEEDNSIIVNYGNNRKYKELTFDDVSLYSMKTKYKPLFEIKKEVPNITQNKLFLCKTGTYENNIELLYLILDCIFNSNTDFYIKICERCGKFFLATRVNKKYCYRPKVVCGKNTTCKNAIETLNKSKEYMKIRRNMNKHLDKYYKRNDEKSLEYISNYQNKFNYLLDNCKKKLDITEEDMKAFNNLNND